MLLWIEGFDNFGTGVGSAPSPTGVVARKYASVNWETSMDVETGRLGGYALQLQFDNGCYFSPGDVTTNDTVVLGFAVKWKTSWPNLLYKRFASLYDGATLGMNLAMTANGEVEVRRGTTTLKTTSGLGLSLGAWAYFEFKVTCADSGSYELRVNGVTVASDTGVNTKAGTHNYHTTFRLTGTSGNDGGAAIYDDLYFLDGSDGGNGNKDFLGDMRVVTIRPDGDDTVQWTPGTGTDHYALVDEIVAGTEDDDAGGDYVEDTVSDHKDLYTYAALAGVTSGIKGIQVNTDARITDAGSFTLKSVVKSGETESADEGQAISVATYTTKSRVVEADPAGGAWSVSAVNAVKAGVQVG